MRYWCLLSLFVFTACISSAQNLVLNPSFEDWLACPHSIGDPLSGYYPIDYDPTYSFFQSVANWTDPLLTTPDYFNSCAPVSTGVNVPNTVDGYEEARTGVAYAGIVALGIDTGGFDYREYIEDKLSQPMILNHSYRVTFYVNLAKQQNNLDNRNNNFIAIDRFGALFSDTLIYNPDSLNIRATPSIVNTPGNYITDTANWVRIQGVYTASGGEQWITLGYFKDSETPSYEYVSGYLFNPANTASDNYYYIDDVCAIDISAPLTTSKDTTLCSRFLPLVLSGRQGGNQYQWSTGDTTASISVSQSGIYWVRSSADCLLTVDTIRVKVDTVKITLSPDAGICQGAAVQLHADGATTGYTWSPATGLSCISCADPVAAPLCSTTYTVWTNPDQYGCSDTGQIIVSVDTAIIAFNISKNPLCIGDTLTVINNSIGAGLSYLWNFGDGITTTQPDPTHVYAQTGTYMVSLSGINGFCTDTADQLVAVDSMYPVSFFSDKKQVCEGEAINFYPTYTQGAESLIWNFGDNSIIGSTGETMHSYDTSGEMIVTLTAQYPACADTSFKDTVWVYPYPVVDIGPDTSVCPGQPLSLKLANLATQNKIVDYTNIWSTGDTTADITVVAPGTYWLTISTDKGCNTSDTVEVKPNCYLGIPNAFTPNGDGINDYFFPRQFLSDGLTSFKMEIYNRWGEKVFYTMNTDGRGWDGRFNGELQPEGVFIYVIDATFKNGKTEHYQGNVTLLK